MITVSAKDDLGKISSLQKKKKKKLPYRVQLRLNEVPKTEGFLQSLVVTEIILDEKE